MYVVHGAIKGQTRLRDRTTTAAQHGCGSREPEALTLGPRGYESAGQLASARARRGAKTKRN